MEPLKAGDWITFTDISNKNLKQIIKIENGIAYTKSNKCLVEQATKWHLEPGEWCWRKYNGNYILFQYIDTKHTTWDLQPYIGELPSGVN